MNGENESTMQVSRAQHCDMEWQEKVNSVEKGMSLASFKTQDNCKAEQLKQQEKVKSG